MRLVLSSSLLAVLVVTVVESAFEQQQFQTFTRYGKRGLAESEGGRQLFYTNSRYGKRAPGPMGNVARLWSGRPKGNVQPRADKFFINSRYGKRSSPSPQSTTKEHIYPELTESTADVYSDAATGRALDCSFTGYTQLYHCTQRQDAATAAGDSADENQSNE